MSTSRASSLREPRPLERVLTLLDVLLGRSPVVVEGDRAIAGAAFDGVFQRRKKDRPVRAGVLTVHPGLADQHLENFERVSDLVLITGGRDHGHKLGADVRMAQEVAPIGLQHAPDLFVGSGSGEGEKAVL